MQYNPYFQQQMPFYNSGAVPDTLGQYKNQYQYQAVQPTAQFQQMNTSNSSDMIWVLNEVEAQSFPVSPNNSVVLWDKNNNVLYIKSVNSQGVPSMRILDYTERISDVGLKTAENGVLKNEYVTKDEITALKDKINEIESKLCSIEEKPTKKTKKGEE